jgi:hypothetical protein
MSKLRSTDEKKVRVFIKDGGFGFETVNETTRGTG